MVNNSFYVFFMRVISNTYMEFIYVVCSALKCGHNV